MTNDSVTAPPTRSFIAKRLAGLGDRTVAWVVAILAFAVYANSLANEFAYDDDMMITQNPLIESLGNFGKFFSSGYWQQWYGGTSSYRPLFVLSLAIDHALWGGRPFGFHLTNVALHCAASALFFLLARKYRLGRGVSFLAAAIFAVHPVHTEAVANIVGRMELLGTVFCGLAWFFWNKGRQTERPSAGRLLLAALMFLCAILTKENFIVFPAVLFAAEWISSRPLPDFRTTARAVLPYLAFVAGVGVYLLMRRSSGEAVQVASLNRAPLADFTLWGRVCTMGSVSLEWYRLLLLGFPLRPWYDRFNLEIVAHPTLRSWIGFGVFFGLAALAALAVRRLPLVSFSIFLWFALMFIVSNIPFPIGAIFGERWLYFPSAGYCLALALGIFKLRDHLKSRGGGRMALVLAGAVLFSYATVTIRRNPDWRDNLTLFSRMLQTDPGHPLGYSAVASQLTERDPARARELLHTAYRIAPDHFETVVALAKLDFLENRLDEAEALADGLLAIEPPNLALPAADWSEVHLLKAGIRYRRGDRVGGDLELANGIRYSPVQYGERLFISTALLKFGNKEEALKILLTIIQTNPNLPQAHNNLGVCFLRMGRFDEAKAEFETTLRLNPKHEMARRNLEWIRQRSATAPPSPPVAP